MSHAFELLPTQTEPVLTETELEERDGHTWVAGLCPFCWERIAFTAPPEGTQADVECPNGHALRIIEQTTAGANEHRH
jgi:hypothetical protein